MSEEVALANANVAELAAAQATIDGQRRLIEQLKTDNAALLGAAQRAGLVYNTYYEAMADAALLKAEHPGAELLAEHEQLRTVITRQVEQSATDHQALTEVRAALAEAQAELDRSQPIVIAAARLVASIHGDGNGRCWCGAREADQLRSALEKARLV